MSSSIDAAIVRLSAMTGLPLVRCEIVRPGVQAEGARIAGVAPGRGLAVSLTRTMTSAEAVVVAEDSAGPLVRRLGLWAQDNPEDWRGNVEQVEASGVDLTVTVNEQMLDDAGEVPDGLWRSFTIECWKRSRVKSQEDVVASLVAVGGPALALALAGLVPSDEDAGGAVELTSFEPLPEGAKVRIEVNRYERSPVNRMRCISHYGAVCWVCGLDFGNKYGAAAAGFIEVHHRIPVSSMGGSYVVDPIKDLVPLCSNCHSVAHRRTPPFQPAEIRELMGLPPKTPELPVVV